jgi:hypothetical protein
LNFKDQNSLTLGSPQKVHPPGSRRLSVFAA